jgi:hypothetical protein
MTTAATGLSKSTESQPSVDIRQAIDFEPSQPAISPRVLEMLTLLNQEFDAQSPVQE